ncbi:MAG: hypothetical protein HZA90_20170, partial [Verrucomicrobia bacterium]|nr:hypothetical protein [Verrucomicrobiota bacterium]
MLRTWVYGGVLLALIGGLVCARTRWSRDGGSEPLFVTTPPPEAAPLCPWRDPDSDLKTFFPNATQHTTETRVLSGQRVELTTALGRPPSPDEHALHLHRVFHEQRVLGTVLTRRVKGEAGAIELVLAVAPDGRVRGLRLQRLREPAEIAASLQRPGWLAAFAGKTAANQWQLGADLPDVPGEARLSAQAIVEGVRSLLLLLNAAERADPVATGEVLSKPRWGERTREPGVRAGRGSGVRSPHRLK